MQIFTIWLVKVLLTCQVSIYNMSLISLFQILSLWGRVKGEGSEKEGNLWKNAAFFTQNPSPYFHFSLCRFSNYPPNVWNRLEFVKYWRREFSAPENIHALSCAQPLKERRWKFQGDGGSQKPKLYHEG